MGAKEMVVTYEEAMQEFATSATEFLEHIALLTKARDSFQRAMAVSTQLRRSLDNNDEILRTLMAKVEQAIDVPHGKDSLHTKNLEPLKVDGEKANTARV